MNNSQGHVHAATSKSNSTANEKQGVQLGETRCKNSQHIECIYVVDVCLFITLFLPVAQHAKGILLWLSSGTRGGLSVNAGKCTFLSTAGGQITLMWTHLQHCTQKVQIVQQLTFS